MPLGYNGSRTPSSRSLPAQTVLACFSPVCRRDQSFAEGWVSDLFTFLISYLPLSSCPGKMLMRRGRQVSWCLGAFLPPPLSVKYSRGCRHRLLFVFLDLNCPLTQPVIAFLRPRRKTRSFHPLIRCQVTVRSASQHINLQLILGNQYFSLRTCESWAIMGKICLG